MSNSLKIKSKCMQCWMHPSLCVCSFIPKIELQTKIILIIHHTEMLKASNTGHLAVLSLLNSEMRIRGDKTPMMTEGLVVSDRQSLVLYPYLDANELTKAYLKQFDKPITLIVPDGNWRQACKVGSREPLLRDLPKVKLPEGQNSNYRLRKESKPDGMATLEGIARALAIIEGDFVQEKLEGFMNIMVERLLWTRGKIKKYEI